MKELATKIINFAKENRACDRELTPALKAFEAGDYETILMIARRNTLWLIREGFEITDILLLLTNKEIIKYLRQNGKRYF